MYYISISISNSGGLYQPPRRPQVMSPSQDDSTSPVSGTERTLSLRAVHVPGRLNKGTDMLSRNNVASVEWILHPQTVQMIWSVFGKAEVDLFTSKDNCHCPT